MSTPEPRSLRGVIGWMTQNRVTPNVLMLVFLVGGLYMSTRIKQEVFPEFELDYVTVSVVYPGASPEEVERGILLSIESQIRGITGIKKVLGTANESLGVVAAELESGADRQKVYQEIRQAVDRITTFPRDSERPSVTLLENRRAVLSLLVHGDVPEGILREAAERAYERLLKDPRISQVDMLGIREFRITVEVPEATLRAHGLTLQEISNRITAASVEVPGGKIETRGGQILLRVRDRRDWARQFARIPIVTTAEGAVMLLGDLAQVAEGFEETSKFATYDGRRSVLLEVYTVGKESPMAVSRAVREVMNKAEAELPPGVTWSVQNDRSTIYQARLELLLRNAFMGLLLVLVCLGIFLDLRLAFWVTLGIPTSFLGALLFLPSMDVSINMISMFAFIIALGIVVDDAIVAGDNIYEYRRQGKSYLEAAVLGARDVSIPITVSILTNIVAFLPLLYMEGIMGKIWRVIPLVVVTVFAISWVEALVILPSHLAHTARQIGPPGRFARAQAWVAGRMDWFIARFYAPFLTVVLRWRTFTMAVGFSALIMTATYAMSGRLGWFLMPRVESDVAVATAILPVGSSEEKVRRVRDRLESSVREVARRWGQGKLLSGVQALVEENKVEVIAFLKPPAVRPLGTREVTQRWRQLIGPVPGLESLKFEADRGGPGRGAAITVELSHRDTDALRRAAEALAAKLAEYPSIKDIDDGDRPGKAQMDFRITTAGQSLGLTSAEVARQVRNAFYGAEAVRQQRGRSEVRVLVRRPEAERQSAHDVESLLISTGEGRSVPIRQVATLAQGRAYTTITRRDSQRTVEVTADVEPLSGVNQIKASLTENVLPALVRDTPGLTFSFEGHDAVMRESMASLMRGFAIALIAIFVLLAIPFRSYVQPVIVMIAIPFGVIGAILGHLVMGYSLSLISMLGVVALSGVVVNDSLVLIDFANQRMQAGVDPLTAIHEAGVRRFRPIILTTLTTFGGLAPMIFETSRQARFMIPMAISLGFGILFSTVITLVLVPCLFVQVERVRGWLAHLETHR
jgi:multidrug efflux pump subunit AcrB